MKKNLRRFVMQAGLPSAVVVLSIAILGSLLLWKITRLVPGWSAAELATKAASINHHVLLSNPVNAPYKVIVYGLLKVAPHSVLALRLVSVAYGALTIGLFYYVVRCWHSARIAWLSSLLFACSSWFLLTARLGTPDVLLFSLLTLTALGLMLQRTRHRTIMLYVLAVVAGMSLYVPGLIWFVCIAAFWQRAIIKKALRRAPIWLSILAAVSALLVLVPMGLAIAKHGQLAWAIFGLPAHLPTPITILKHLGDVPLNIFIRGPLMPGLWVGRSPLLDVFESVLFIFGVYAYWQHRRLARFASLFSIFILTSILIALGGPVSLSLLLPFVYLVIATGMAFLLGEWLSVFPRNPLARGLGLSVVVIAVLVSCTYQINRYFVAWPHTPGTTTVFSQPPPKS
jgi:hypothetical protein